MVWLSFLLQSSGSGNPLIGWLPLILMFVVIWFFFLRPQAKKQKEQARFVQEIQKGDEVVTSSGIVGRINKLEDQFVSLQVDTKTFLKVSRSSVSKEMTEQLLKSKSE